MKESNFLPSGLTIEEVNQRIIEGKTNIVKTSGLKSTKQIIFGNLFSYFNLILTVLGVLLISIKSYENLFFMLIAVLNTIIGIIQEIKARNTIKNLSFISEAKALVIRQNFEIEVLIQEIVIDDIYHVSLGKQIVTDATIIMGTVTVNESNLTGESEPIVKNIGDEIRSGSFVVSGNGYAKVIAVGKDNYIEKLSAKVKTLGKPTSEILGSLRKLLKIIGIIIIPLGLMTFYNAYQTSGYDYFLDFLHEPVLYQNALKKMAGAMVAMVPSGLFLLTTVTFATSVVKLSKHQTLVQELYSIETLSRIDMICLDKTGTITDGTMEVDEYIPLETTEDIDITPSTIDASIVIQSMNYALSDDNQTSRALHKYFGKKRKLRVKNTLTFDSLRKYSACTFDEGSFAIGAPEMIFKGKYLKIKKVVEKYARLGKRVLLFAKVDEISNDMINGSVYPIGLILIEDHIRSSAKTTLDEFQESGVEIKVISGDNALTVSEVARRAGVPNAHKYLSLEKISDEKLVEVCSSYNVFGRVSPNQKKLLIQTFKQNNHKVAMIGDGVNDILALKEADCSVALAGGSEAATNISHLVLLNNDFSSLPQVVKQGRQIVSNMKNASVLYLVKTVYTILLTIVLLITSKIYPFEPVQMVVIETFIIGIPSAFIALEPNTTRFQGVFLKKVFKLVIPGSLLVIANLLGVYLFASFWPNITDGEISTVGIIAATFAYLLVLVNVSMPLNKRRSIIVISSLFVSAFCFIVLGKYFKLESLSIPSILLLMLLMESTYIIMSVVKKDLIKFWP
ncbi:MAG: HAD-IC family P-type ATPase [Candidatus Izemoplasmatales bacterium]|jgi:cation-transporting ATPase E|nr:HAD-IC family P-type ATPase [Candidatus Izemoplasmatales bacterium]